MALAYSLAQQLGPAPELPRSLTAVEKRVQLVQEIDAPLVEHLNLTDVVVRIGKRIRQVADPTKSYMPDVPDPLARVNIALRIWSGCLWAAKTIALETRSGPNAPALRGEIMQEVGRGKGDKFNFLGYPPDKQENTIRTRFGVRS